MAMDEKTTVRADSLLCVEGLWVVIRSPTTRVAALRGASFTVEPGERVGIVGESGSGKSTLALSIIGLLSADAYVTAGTILYRGINLVGASPQIMATVRGIEIAVVFQNAATALNPLRRVGDQIADVLVIRLGLSRVAARAEAVSLLRSMGITSERAFNYPHQYSGGMAQRALIGMAIACSPALLIADEPTTGLDPLVQEQVLALILQTVQSLETSLLLISHDIETVARVCNRIVVMYAGEVLEVGPTSDVLDTPRSPYTRELVAASELQPGADGHVAHIPGRVPVLPADYPGCSFSGRCPLEEALGRPTRCKTDRPDLQPTGERHAAACHFLDQANRNLSPTPGLGDPVLGQEQ